MEFKFNQWCKERVVLFRRAEERHQFSSSVTPLYHVILQPCLRESVEIQNNLVILYEYSQEAKINQIVIENLTYRIVQELAVSL